LGWSKITTEIEKTQLCDHEGKLKKLVTSGVLIRTPPLTTILFFFKLVHVQNFQRRHSVILSSNYFLHGTAPARLFFHSGEYPFSQELENEAKDSGLSKSPNDQHLAISVYQLMEAKAGGKMGKNV
jgi:hypothetical protein